jgi:hypothetical protein
MISYISEHDEGAGHETTTRTALRAKVNRAKTPEGRAQDRAESCCNTVSATEEVQLPSGQVVTYPLV